jgi:Zn-dependent protease with chaperone function
VRAPDRAQLDGLARSRFGSGEPRWLRSRALSAGNGLFESEQIERGRSYHRPLYLAAVAGIALDLGLLALLSFSVLGDHLYASTERLPWWARCLVFSLCVLALSVALPLPIAFWASYLHEHAWALSTQSLGGWLLDRLKGLALTLLFGASALLGLVAAARAWPAAWPLIVATAAAFVVLTLSFIAPVLLEPLFSRFTPLADRELADSLQGLAARAGVPVGQILVADASRRTRKLNAYVSGLGRTRRLVLFDTLLGEASREEVELVVAHELGHRRAWHVAKATLLGLLGAAAFVTAFWALLPVPALRSALGVTGAGDPRIVPFVLLLGSLFSLTSSPLSAGLSRHWERQADAFSLELTRDLATFESTHRRLALVNVADLAPPRLFYLAWFSHPTPSERIAGARALQPAAGRTFGRRR